MELAQERDEDIPALVYEARPVSRAAARQRQQQSPAELRGVTVEPRMQRPPTEGASGGGSVKLPNFLCLLRSGDSGTSVKFCRKLQCKQVSLSTRSTLMEWGPTAHLMQRTGWLTAAH